MTQCINNSYRDCKSGAVAFADFSDVVICEHSSLENSIQEWVP